MRVTGCVGRLVSEGRFAMALLFRVEPCGLVGGRCRCKPAPGDQGHGSKMESMALLSWRHKKHEVTEVLPAHKTWTSVSTGNPLHGLCAFESKGVVLATLGQAILDLIGWDAARLFASKEVASLWLPRFWLSLLSYDLRAKVSPCLKLILLKKKKAFGKKFKYCKWLYLNGWCFSVFGGSCHHGCLADSSALYSAFSFDLRLNSKVHAMFFWISREWNLWELTSFSLVNNNLDTFYAIL